eukprot:COSAG02_NODE_57436_length_280_cov_1.209945_1_plen_38_part_10
MELALLSALLVLSAAPVDGWSGPRVSLIKGDGLPHFHL